MCRVQVWPQIVNKVKSDIMKKKKTNWSSVFVSKCFFRIWPKTLWNNMKLWDVWMWNVQIKSLHTRPNTNLWQTQENNFQRKFWRDPPNVFGPPLRTKLDRMGVSPHHRRVETVPVEAGSGHIFGWWWDMSRLFCRCQHLISEGEAVTT